jgi:hypothetical protein
MEHQLRREIEIQSHLRYILMRSHVLWKIYITNAHQTFLRLYCRHPNVLRMHGYFYDETRIYLILEFAANGEMYKYLKRQPTGRFSEPQYIFKNNRNISSVENNLPLFLGRPITWLS